MEKPSYLEIAYNSIDVFADDGTLDLGELNFLMGLALRDNVIDEDEKRVLANIFDRANDGKLSRLVARRIEQIREKHGI